MIREYLFGRLADFKIPSQVLIVDEIPKGTTGKTQRIGLATKFAQQLKGEFVAPKGQLETILASIYAEVLGVEQISANDNFFIRGGDSLRATQVMSRLRVAFHVELPLRTLFEKPTVEELARVITQSQVDEKAAHILAELETLSDEEAQKLLAGESTKNRTS